MAADFMKEYHLIVNVMNACTHDISTEVKYAYLHPRIVDIFPPMTLDREEAKGKGSYDTMVNICNSAKLLSKEDFIRFVDAINADYPNRAREIRKKYQELSGNELPHLPTALDTQVPIQCYQDTLRPIPETQQPVLESGIPPINARPRVQKMMASNDEETYSMDTQPRGMALIINNVNFITFSERVGSEEDVRHLSRMFEKLKFSTFTVKNLSAMQMKQECTKFSKDRNLQNVSALSVVILTHGSTNECYFGIDGLIDKDKIPSRNTYITKAELAQIFNSRNCPLMKEKPKLFIIQACRGEDENPAEVEYQTCNGENMKPDIPGSEVQEDMPIQVPYVAPRADTADMCFLHSSSTGYRAYRDEIRGSPFIEELTELIIKSKAADEIKNIILQLQRAFSQKCLINSKMTLPDFSTQLVKSWYIIPE
ncbi:caspase-14-like [Biomphalaria glabrata]|uniref:Caspase-14-like n=1 Tax=Biomphalaria glabrata TaxID=6526 RepID=A0A9W2YPF0_BIOGL|nr:caspase-14-like [Biomphalaria glabrata]XP_055864594.1 caspase-14-like [Biomphalaria glabrata]XP_055864595.1 caspase-14-like [Biomphalaria glabrata]